ncbi:MAG: glycosyltransferase [Candidatus Margulisiibacteriota bacterium]|jgi:glycosyltransferase involved in cell wall biosynthesis
MNPKVSVVIATHNHAHFLPDCLNSVKGQTYQDYEVIVVDNGSTDDTKEVIERLAWDKLRYHYQKDTGSVAGPRNTGGKLARGEYLAYLDSDDSWYPDKLAKVMEVFADHPETDLVTHHLRTVVHGKPGGLLLVGPDKGDVFRALLLGNCVLGSATVVRKKAMDEIGGFDGDKGFVHVEDYEAWLRLAAKGKKFFFLDATLGDYRIHKSNLSHDFKTAFDNELRAVRKHFRGYVSRYPLDNFFLYRSSLARIYLRLSYRYFLYGQLRSGLLTAFRSLLNNPYYALRLGLETAGRRVIKWINPKN